MRRTIAFICLVMMLVISVPAMAGYEHAEGDYAIGGIYEAGVVFPYAWAMVVNTSVTHSPYGIYIEIDKIQVFIKADDTESYLWQITDAVSTQGELQGDTFSLPNRYTNVIGAPNWIWECRYATPNSRWQRGGIYTSGRGSVYLSNNCIPMAHTRTTECNFVW